MTEQRRGDHNRDETGSVETIDQVLMGQFLHRNLGLYIGYIVCVLVAFPCSSS